MILRDSTIPLVFFQSLLLFKRFQSLINLFRSAFSRPESTSFVVLLFHFSLVIICLREHLISFVEITKPFPQAYRIEDVTPDFSELFYPPFTFFIYHLVASHGELIAETSKSRSY